MTEHDTVVQARPPAPVIPSLEEEHAAGVGQLVPLAGAAASDPLEAPQAAKQRPQARPRRRKKLSFSHSARLVVRLVVVALALTLAFTAGIGAGSFLIAWISALMQGAGAPVHVPIQTGAIVSAAGGLAVVVLGVRYGAERFSKHKYPFYSCEACKGGGKDFEPRWLRLLRWSRRRAWRKCPTCDGNPTENR